jgi:hypothetical protein
MGLEGLVLGVANVMIRTTVSLKDMTMQTFGDMGHSSPY